MEKRKIKLADQYICFLLKRSKRAKHLRLTIYSGGRMTATLPLGMAYEKLEKFLHQKAGWILRKVKVAKRRSSKYEMPRSSKREYIARKKEALDLASQKVEYFGKIYNLHPKKISIRNQKSRWGSCSKKGNLNFNYKILHLPPKYADYVVVHELCHLQEFNHSERFWKLVEKEIPDYKKIRKEIRNL